MRRHHRPLQEPRPADHLGGQHDPGHRRGGQLYRETTNPPVATADGLAMAYRAGAVLRDMEFMQFHPTTLYIAGASRALITETLRGEGAYLLDTNGRRFMKEYTRPASWPRATWSAGRSSSRCARPTRPTSTSTCGISTRSTSPSDSR